MNLEKIIKREILITALTVIGIAVTFFGVTYAIYFTIDEENIGSVAFGQLSFDMCLESSCSTGGTTYGTTISSEVYPMNTTEGTSQTPYTFIITNNATQTMNAKVYAAKEGLSADYTNVKVAAKVQGTSTYSYGNLTQDTSVLINLELGAGQSKIIEVYAWLDEGASNEMIGKEISVFVNAIGYFKPDDPSNLHTGDAYVANLNTTLLNGQTFEYTGDYQEFEAPASGYYFIEAQGPYNSSTNGSLVSGYIFLSKEEKLYIYTGNTGTSTSTDVRYFGSTPSDSNLAQNSEAGQRARIMNASAGGSDLTDSFMSGYSGVDMVNSSGTSTANTLHYSGKYFINGNSQLNQNSSSGKVTIKYVGLVERENTKLDNVRYIKDCLAGNSKNGWNAWVEVQAIKDGTNLAKGKTPTGITANGTYGGPVANITDGNILTTNYTNTTAAGNYTNECINIDLGATYNLDELAVWHYYEDGRVYYSNITSVSSNNSTWTEVINETMPESADAKRVSAYRDIVNGYIQNGLLVWYDGISNTGTTRNTTTTTWKNLAVNNYDGTITSGTWGNSYLTFNGTSTWVNIGQINPTVFTADIVFKQNATNSGYQDLIANWNSGGLALAIKNNNFIAAIHNSGAYKYNTDSLALGTTNIYQYAVAFNQTSNSIYRSGSFVKDLYIGGAITTPSSNTVLALGADPSGSTASAEFLNGNIYGVRFYNRVLSEEEIYHNYLVDKERFGLE